MVLGPSPAWLTEQGYLAPARVFAPPGFSSQGLRKRMGDYDMAQASELLQAGQAMGDALAHYSRHLSGRTAIAFCCSIAHAEAVARMFDGAGVPAASIDGSMDSATRRRLLEQLGTGELKVLTSCALIGEGVDVPSVGGCILLRPTQSEALHLQMIGRCLRPQDGKVAVVLDHVGNTLRLGHHLDDREWTLKGVRKRQREAAVSVKVCPQCFAACSSRVMSCPECGHEFRPERRELEHVEGELKELPRAVPPEGFKDGDAVRNVNSNYVYRVVGGRKQFLDEFGKVTDDPVYYYDCEKVDGKGRRFKTSILEKNLEPAPYDVMLPGMIISTGQESPKRLLDIEKHNSLIWQQHQQRSRAQEQGQATTLEQLEALGRRRQMRDPRSWARHVLAARQRKGQWSKVG
jgi:hypothetical protein